MKAVGVLAVLLGFQGIPIAPQASGTVTGLLRNADGKPAVGVRVAAMTRPDAGTGGGAGTVLASITETDERGRYRLESIPPGQYYIVAGRVDRPTFYPGAQQITAGKVLRVTPGAVLSGIDFVMSDSSVRTPITDVFGSATISMGVQLQVVTEDGIKLPISSSTGPVALRFKRKADGLIIDAPVIARSANLTTSISANPDSYQVTVENLPKGYVVKSVMYGSTDITSGVLPVQSPATMTVLQSTVGAVLVTTNPTNVFFFASRLALPDPVTVTLTVSPQAAGTPGKGVRVSGLGRPSDTHPVYLSGKPGTVFSDGTFEFVDVPPGRHTIATIDFPGRALGTTIIVGDRDLEGVRLDDVTALPTDIQTPVAPGPTDGIAPGTKLPLASIRGRFIEEATQKPPASGQVFISGRNGPSYSLDEDGTFEIHKLLPGVYKVETQVAGHNNIIREVRVDTDDVTLEVISRKQD